MNFGSDIRFEKQEKGHKRGLKYIWVAHANSNYPETIFFNKSNFWFQVGVNKVMIRTLRRVISHEINHNILWQMLGIKKSGEYDYIVKKFRKRIKKECPKTWRDYNVF